MKNIIILFLAANSENCLEEDTEVISGRSGIVDSLSKGLFLEINFFRGLLSYFQNHSGNSSQLFEWGDVRYLIIFAFFTNFSQFWKSFLQWFRNLNT